MESCHMHSSMMAGMSTSKCTSPIHHILANQCISAKYGQPDPEKARGVLEGMDAGRDGSSEEGSSGQVGVNKKSDKQA